MSNDRGIAVRMNNGIIRHLIGIETASQFLRALNVPHTWFRTYERTLVSGAHIAEVMGVLDDD